MSDGPLGRNAGRLMGSIGPVVVLTLKSSWPCLYVINLTHLRLNYNNEVLRKGEINAGGDKRGDGIADLLMLELLQEALTYGPFSGITLVLADCKLPVHLENKSLRNFSCTSLYQIKLLARNTFLAPLIYRLEYF